MNIGKEYTYWHFLKENKITIPVIQRDYAQGRAGKEELRKHFLTNLLDALNDNKRIVLDFVYGTKESGEIIPLDGQQRLTTLWLLHWYAYLKADKKNVTKENLNIFRNFSYKTRVSSRKFVEELCNDVNFKMLREKGSNNIREVIVGQTWFMKDWEQDPTVKAMLNMLGGDNSIEQFFKNSFGLWDKLTTSKCPIKFFYLPIDGEIQQEPDDIYIKMNARGEHLTDFENFKADLIKFVQDDKDHIDEWEKYFCPNNEGKPELKLSILIDTSWTDVFWKDLENKHIIKKQGEEKPLPSVDKQFFAFLNRFFVNCILIQDISANVLTGKTKPDDVTRPKAKLFQYLYGKDGSADTSICYKDFEIYKQAGVVTPENFHVLKNIMAVLTNDNPTKNLSGWMKNDNSTKEFTFLPQLKTEKGSSESFLPSITQIHRVVFFGVCCYFIDNVQYENKSFQEWMRYVWNMARNSDVQTVDSMQNVMKHLNNVRLNACNIIGYLTQENTSSDNKSYFDRQKNEEILKAKLYDKKKNEIINAENAFHGSIRFLLSEPGQKDLLKKDMLNKAQEIISDNWINEILPYLVEVFDDANTKEIIFGKKDDDKVKIVNYSDVLIPAFRNKLLESTPSTVQKGTWAYLLTSLINYSNTKKIGIKEKDGKKGVYLYKGSNWSEKNCILLYSYEPKTQEMVNNRNKFIDDCIKKKFNIYIEEDNLDETKMTVGNPHYGRAIVIKNESTTLYCRVDGYYIDGQPNINNY